MSHPPPLHNSLTRFFSPRTPVPAQSPAPPLHRSPSSPALLHSELSAADPSQASRPRWTKAALATPQRHQHVTTPSSPLTLCPSLWPATLNWPPNLTASRLQISKELSKDHLQFAPDAKVYVSTLIADVQEIVAGVERERDLHSAAPPANLGRSVAGNKRPERERTLHHFQERALEAGGAGGNFANSLGLTMEGKNGIYMAIIKGTAAEARGEEQILLRKNYQNLEELISHTMAYDDYDSHYLKLVKLNRLKVLMELCMKVVGRPFNDIGHEERSNLELEANRFHTTYPLPGEEVLVREAGGERVRMPLAIVAEEGQAKVALNEHLRLDPADFLTLYTHKLLEYAHATTGLHFANITLAIPATYGAAQREALKTSVNEAADRDDVQILTRPVAAAVILNNQRNNDQATSLANSASLSSYSPEVFKLVFDMTQRLVDTVFKQIFGCTGPRDV